MNTPTKLHIGLHVSDVTKSIGFYNNLLESEPVKVHTDYAKFETDQLVLSLIQKANGPKPSFGHFGIRVSDEETLQRHYARLNNGECPILLEGKTDCCYALQDKFWATDPDGYQWEFYQFLQDTGVETKQQPVAAAVENEVCCAPSCCA